MAALPWTDPWLGTSDGGNQAWAPARRTAAVYPGPGPCSYTAAGVASSMPVGAYDQQDLLGKTSMLVGRPESPIGLATSAGCWNSSMTSVAAGCGVSSQLATGPGSLPGILHARAGSGASTMTLHGASSGGEVPTALRIEAPTDRNPPARVPILNKDGRVVGYRQDSSRLAWTAAACRGASSDMERSASSTPSSASCSAAFSSSILDGGQQQFGVGAAAPSLLLLNGDAPLEPCFAAAAAEVYKGFPDAANQLPGYVLGPVAGRGGFCTVRRALHEATGAEVAIKVIEKARLRDVTDRDRVEREVRVMRALNNHVSIVRVLESAETRDMVYVVMEHCSGGSLLDRVRERRALPESETCLIFQQLLAALAACHSAGIVHRDVKLENILFDAEGGVQLIDFGLCGFFTPGQKLRCHCGSPSYAAPEIVARREYLAPPVDVWSLGVVLFGMLAGHLPFHSRDKKHLSEKIVAGRYRMPSWVSPDAQDLLAGMLCTDPARRLTLAQCAAHDWVRNRPRWTPPGVGPGSLLRLPGDETTGVPLSDTVILAAAQRALRIDAGEMARAVLARDASALAATYFLLADLDARNGLARWEQQRVGSLVASSAPDGEVGLVRFDEARNNDLERVTNNHHHNIDASSVPLAIPRARRHSQSTPDLKLRYAGLTLCTLRFFFVIPSLAHLILHLNLYTDSCFPWAAT